MIVIKTHGGLCNRLRCVFSFYQLSLELKKKLYVIWTPQYDCPGFFLDYFYPIDNIEFVKKNVRKYKITNKEDWCEKYSPYKMFVYEKLKPLLHIQKIIDRNIKLLNNDYVAVHIRRTDHVRYNKKRRRYTTDEDFISFIEQNQNKNLYIATDNFNTQKQFYDRYKKNIKVLNFISPNGQYRQTSLKIAIIDLYLCIHATIFKGSGYSSYSSLIFQFRNSLT